MKSVIAMSLIVLLGLNAFAGTTQVGSAGGNTPQSGDESNLTFWHTGIERVDRHHSEGCNIYNIPALMVQENGAMIESLTSLKAWFGSKSHCSSFRKYEIESRYGQLTKLGKKMVCPAEICQPGTDLVAKNIQITNRYGTGVEKVLFFDQGFVGVMYSLGCVNNNCDDSYDRLELFKLDTKQTNNYLPQMKQVMDVR